MIIITVSIGTSVLLVNIYNASIEDSKNTIILESKLQAQNIKNIIENISIQLKELKAEIEIFNKNDLIKDQDIKLLIKKIYELNPDLEGIFVYRNKIFNKNKNNFISYYGNDYKRFNLEKNQTLNYHKTLINGVNKNIIITKPHYHNINNKNIMVVSILVALRDDNNNYGGFIGADISLKKLQNIIKTIKFQESYSFLFTNDGILLAHSKRPEIQLSSVDQFSKIYSLLKKNALNKTHSFYAHSVSTNQKVLRTLIPIHLNDTDSFWVLSMNTPKRKILENFYFTANNILIFLLILIIVVIYANHFAFSKLISYRLDAIIKYLNELAKGNFNRDLLITSYEDEIGKLQNTSERLKNDLIRLITKIELKDSELSFSKTILQNTLDEFDAGIIIASAPDGKIFAMNKKTLNMDDSQENMVINLKFEQHQKYWKISTKDGIPYDTYDLPLAKSILHGESVKNQELTITNHNGEKLNIVVNSNPIYDKKGKIIAGMAIFMEESDSTDIKPALKEATYKLSSKIDGIMIAPEDISETRLQDLIRVEKLQYIQDAFAKAFDVASIITNTDGTPITTPSNFCKVCDIVRSTETGSQKCFRSDKIIGEKAYKAMKPCIEECHSCGFMDAGAPIVVGGKYIGIWMIGQVDIKSSEEKIKKYAKEIGADVDVMLQAYSEMPERISIDKFEKVVEFLWIMANEISLMGYNNLLLANDLEKTKSLEKKIENERKNLEKTVKDRTLELQESLIRLEKANKHKNNFLSTMSHELRTPLNAIMGFTDLLGKRYYGPMNDKQLEYITLIHDSSHHLLDLINDILNITKIDSGSIEITKEILDINSFASDIYATMLPQFLKKFIKFNYTVDDKVLNPLIDKRKTKQILLNLLSNALKFTPEKGKVDLRIELEEQDTLLFTISDTGIGIPENEVENIFKEFYRIEQNSLQAAAGTGIGLALAKRLVEIQGGKIGVFSTPGEGSTFWFTLPINN